MPFASSLRTRTSSHNRLTLGTRDRKSTRLNSSYANISYAVFCLKKNVPLRISPPATPLLPPLRLFPRHITAPQLSPLRFCTPTILSSLPFALPELSLPHV